MSDEAYLAQVIKLTNMAKMALEEAESWAEGIEDPKLKEEADKLIEEVFE